MVNFKHLSIDHAFMLQVLQTFITHLQCLFKPSRVALLIGQNHYYDMYSVSFRRRNNLRKFLLKEKIRYTQNLHNFGIVVNLEVFNQLITFTMRQNARLLDLFGLFYQLVVIQNNCLFKKIVFKSCLEGHDLFIKQMFQYLQGTFF